MIKFAIFTLLTPLLWAAPSEQYFDLLKQSPKLHDIQGSHKSGEIEIILDPLQIKEAEGLAMERLLNNEVPLDLAWEWSRIGVVAEDQYLFWIRDGVIFPSGEKGTYDRIVWKSHLKADPGVAILPTVEDNKILLNLNYRHATRSWELEIPRGLVQDGETIKGAAARKLMNETGYRLDDCLLLGTMAVDSGILGSLVPVVACKAVSPADRNTDYSEAILDNVILSMDELESALLKGFYDVPLSDKTQRAKVRDPFLTFALLHLKLRRPKD